MTNNIQSKFSIKEVIVTPIILILVVCLLSSIIIFTSLNMTKDGTPLYKTPIWTILLFILMLIWAVRYYLKTFKRYTFFDRGFEIKTVFGKKFHSWKTVKEVSIIKNSYEKILWQYLEEDTLSIHLNNGDTLEIFSKYYQNIPVIRRYFSNRKDLKIVNNYTNDSPFQPSKKRTFKGDFIISFNGFLSVFFILLSCFMLWHSWSSMTAIGLVVLIGIPISILLFFGFQSYYFVIEQKSLFIRNHIFRHIKHQIDLEKVRVIFFEQKFKKESSLRIIYQDFSIVSFQTNTLKNKQWKSLIWLLKKHGVNIVDELFYEFNE